MAAEPVEAIEENESKSKLPMILGALAVFVLGGGAGFGGSMFMGDAEDPEAAEESTTSEDGEEGSSDGDRAVHDLGLFTVNLRGSGGGRILRMEVSLETTKTGLATVQEREAQLRERLARSRALRDQRRKSVE